MRVSVRKKLSYSIRAISFCNSNQINPRYTAKDRTHQGAVLRLFIIREENSIQHFSISSVQVFAILRRISARSGRTADGVTESSSIPIAKNVGRSSRSAASSPQIPIHIPASCAASAAFTRPAVLQGGADRKICRDHSIACHTPACIGSGRLSPPRRNPPLRQGHPQQEQKPVFRS